MQFVGNFAWEERAAWRGAERMYFADRRRGAVGMMHADGEVMGKADFVRLEDCLRCVGMRGMGASDFRDEWCIIDNKTVVIGESASLTSTRSLLSNCRRCRDTPCGTYIWTTSPIRDIMDQVLSLLKSSRKVHLDADNEGKPASVVARCKHCN